MSSPAMSGALILESFAIPEFSSVNRRWGAGLLFRDPSVQGSQCSGIPVSVPMFVLLDRHVLP
jgi:hypothetical protein